MLKHMLYLVVCGGLFVGCAFQRLESPPTKKGSFRPKLDDTSHIEVMMVGRLPKASTTEHWTEDFEPTGLPIYLPDSGYYLIVVQCDTTPKGRPSYCTTVVK